MASRAIRYPLVFGVLAAAFLAAVGLAEAAAPPNDNFGSAIVVSPLPFSNTQSTVDATLEGGEEQPTNCPPMAKTIWYVFTPTTAGVYEVSARESDFDTVLAVYTGSNVNNLTEIACNDDAPTALQSQLLFTASAGVTYRIQLGGYNFNGEESSGTATLKVRGPVPPAPANDMFESAENVASLPFTDTSDNTLATTQTGEPRCGVAPVGKTLWYRFQPASSGDYVIDTVGSSFDTMLVVFTGTALSNLSFQDCNDNINPDLNIMQSRLTMSLTGGTVYWIQAGGYANATLSEYGTLVVNVASSAGTDSDGDGCPDSKETGESPVLGGDRDPNNHWDFFDVTGDSVIELGDALLILGHFGHGHDDDPEDIEMDRYSPDTSKPYRTAQATDGITLQDVLANLAGFGHDCN